MTEALGTLPGFPEGSRVNKSMDRGHRAQTQQLYHLLRGGGLL